MLNKEPQKSENKKEAKGQRTEFQLRSKQESATTVINITRTAKVVKGGKRFGFRALVVIGNGEGKAGVAIGKANQVQLAISKAEFQARKSTVNFPIVNGTIPHEVVGRFGAASVLMRPASAGTGVIAGGGVRLILEAAGLKNILAKSLGSNNACNLAYATIDALKQLRSKEEVLARRGKVIEPAVAPEPAQEEATASTTEQAPKEAPATEAPAA